MREVTNLKNYFTNPLTILKKAYFFFQENHSLILWSYLLSSIKAANAVEGALVVFTDANQENNFLAISVDSIFTEECNFTNLLSTPWAENEIDNIQALCDIPIKKSWLGIGLPTILAPFIYKNTCGVQIFGCHNNFLTTSNMTKSLECLITKEDKQCDRSHKLVKNLMAFLIGIPTSLIVGYYLSRYCILQINNYAIRRKHALIKEKTTFSDDILKIVKDYEEDEKKIVVISNNPRRFFSLTRFFAPTAPAPLSPATPRLGSDGYFITPHTDENLYSHNRSSRCSWIYLIFKRPDSVDNTHEEVPLLSLNINNNDNDQVIDLPLSPIRLRATLPFSQNEGQNLGSGDGLRL
jgi:hypothetical protein